MDNIEYQIAIPSYKRPKELKEKTLAMLEKHNTPKDIITIFVANEEEKKEYEIETNNEYRIVVSAAGKLRSVQFYNKYYKENTPLLNIDDDIVSLNIKEEKGFKEYEGTIQDIVNVGFKTCEANAAKLWGIYPVNNGFFLNDYITVGLKFLIGHFYGSYAGDKILYDERIAASTADDYETTIKSFIEYGSVVRIENICAKTKMFTKGGLSEEAKDLGYKNREEIHNEKITMLVNKYPDLSKINIKASGEKNIRLKNITYDKINIEGIL